VSCASTSSPVRIGGDTFLVSQKSSFGGGGAAQVDAIRIGTEFCSNQGKEFEIDSILPARNMIEASITFKCVAVSKDVQLRKNPDVIIEDARKR
jgi:hypothetical protein